VNQVDLGDHNPPWWTRSVQDHCGPRSDIFLMKVKASMGKAIKGAIPKEKQPEE